MGRLLSFPGVTHYRGSGIERTCPTSNDLITVSVEASQPTQVGATFGEEGIGTYVTTGRSGSQITVFVPNDDEYPAFQLGDAVVFRLTVRDEWGLGVKDSMVQITIGGPESHELLSTLSDYAGNVEAVWQTPAPSMTGLGGTTEGVYIATIADVTASGFSWDGQKKTKAFQLKSHMAAKSNRSIFRSRSISR